MSFIFLFLLILPLTGAVWPQIPITEDDKETLLKIKKQLGDPDILRNWEEDGFSFCESIFRPSYQSVFVTCDNNGRIDAFYLQGINTTAPFPDSICDLSELTDLHLDQIPGLYGPIPSCVATKLKLYHFHVTETSLSGTLPNFYNSTIFTTINVTANQLSGTIPSSLSNLPNLLSLDLSSNHLTGTIPSDINAFEIVLSNNNLTGEIPKFYGQKEFTTFDVGYNNLRGDASFLFGKEKMTMSIILTNNNFEFDLSYVEFSDYLLNLDISHNKIYGKVPASFATAAHLFWHQPNLSCNRLCGELPQGGNMHLFQAEDFADNACLCGSPLPPCNYSPPPPTYTPPF